MPWKPKCRATLRKFERRRPAWSRELDPDLGPDGIVASHARIHTALDAKENGVAIVTTWEPLI